MAILSYGRAISVQAEQDPHRIALICGEERLTRRELDLRSNRLARVFAERGVGSGDFVTLDYKGRRGDEEVQGAAAEDAVIEVGGIGCN